MGKGEKEAVLPTSFQYGFLLSFSLLEYGKIAKSGGGGIDWGGGNRLPTSYSLYRATNDTEFLQVGAMFERSCFLVCARIHTLFMVQVLRFKG